MKRKNIRTLSLLVVTLTYLVIGAAFFEYLESPTENTTFARFNATIHEFREKHNMSQAAFDKMWHVMLYQKPFEAGHQWKFMGSLYFCTLVVTLIGYGHSTPRTGAGKLFCIVYTVVGIPIFLIMFQSVGERLNSLIVFLLSNVKKKLGFKNTDVSRLELIAIELGLTITIMIVASYIFMSIENWEFFDAIYYTFITLTTIGFGDLVPLQQDNALSEQFSYACFTILFILIGLTTLASSMNLLVLRLAEDEAEEQIQERIEQEEAFKQIAHIDGDIITFNARNSSSREGPEEIENVSVFSCNYEVCTPSWRSHTCCCWPKQATRPNLPAIRVDSDMLLFNEGNKLRACSLPADMNNRTLL